MANVKIERLNHAFQQEISMIIMREVKKDMDCGITLENCQDYKEGDIIEVYELVEIKR